MGAKGSQETVGRKQHAERSRVNHGRVKVKNSRRRVDRSTDVHSQAAVESNRVGTPRLAKKVGAPPHNTSEDLTLERRARGKGEDEEQGGEQGGKGKKRSKEESKGEKRYIWRGNPRTLDGFGGCSGGCPPFSD